MEQKEKQKKPDLSAGLFLFGLFGGLALGLLYDETAVGVLAGLAVGFLMSFLYKALTKK